MGRTAEGWKLWCDKKTGIYHARFRHQGTRYTPSLGTRDAVEAAARAPAIYADVVAGRWQPSPGVGAKPDPLDELVALWLTDYRAGRPGKTADAYELQWSTHLGPFFEWDFARLTRASFKAYQTKRLGEVTRKTLTKELSALNVFLTWLVETERIDEEAKPIIPKLPRGALGTKHKQGRKKRRAELSPEQATALLCTLPERVAVRKKRGESIWCRPYFVVLYETGLRPDTVATLRVPEHWRPGAHELDLAAEHDKGRFERGVPLTSDALEALERVAAELPPEGGLLFGAHDFRRQLELAADEWALPPVTPYDLRHDRATHLLDGGAPLGGVAYLLGHRRVTTTATYAKPTRRAAEKALGGIREVPKGKKPGAKGGT